MFLQLVMRWRPKLLYIFCVWSFFGYYILLEQFYENCNLLYDLMQAKGLLSEYQSKYNSARRRVRSMLMKLIGNSLCPHLVLIRYILFLFVEFPLRLPNIVHYLHLPVIEFVVLFIRCYWSAHLKVCTSFFDIALRNFIEKCSLPTKVVIFFFLFQSAFV